MVETSAQKRKAEDETAAMATGTLGETAQPAAKKVKSEHEQAPSISEPAASDAGMTGTVNEVHDAAQAVKQEDKTSAPETKTEVKSESADGDANMSSEVAAESDHPQTLGYKTFKDGDEAFQYFHDLIHDLRHDQDLNEVCAIYSTTAAFVDMDSLCNMVSLLQYEHNIVLDLVKKGHPEPDTKVCTNLRLTQLASILISQTFTEQNQHLTIF